MPPAPMILPLGAPLTVSAFVSRQLDRRGDGEFGRAGLRGRQRGRFDRDTHRASKPAQVEIIIRILSSLRCSRHDNRKPPLLPQAEVPQVEPVISIAWIAP